MVSIQERVIKARVRYINSHVLESQHHNEFLNIHLYIHICHCRVCICCFYCLEGYNCILWTENNKWLSQPRSTTSSILYTSDLLYRYGYFFIQFFWVCMHFFIIYIYKRIFIYLCRSLQRIQIYIDHIDQS